MPRIRMTVKQVLNMTPQQINKATTRDIRAAVRALSDAASKRLKAFTSKHLTSSAERYIRESGGVKSTRKMKLPELRQELARLRGFITAETGTVTGEMAVRNQVVSELQKAGITISVNEYDLFWRAYEELAKQNSIVREKRALKYQVLEKLTEKVYDSKTPKTVADIVAAMKGQVTNLYEQHQEQVEQENADLSDFFTIGEDMET